MIKEASNRDIYPSKYKNVRNTEKTFISDWFTNDVGILEDVTEEDITRATGIDPIEDKDGLYWIFAYALNGRKIDILIFFDQENGTFYVSTDDIGYEHSDDGNFYDGHTSHGHNRLIEELQNLILFYREFNIDK